MRRQGGTYTGFTGIGSSLFDAAANPAMVFGHDVMYLVGKSSTLGRTRIQIIRPNQFFLVDGGSFEVNVTVPADTPYSVGMVTAPEPVSLLILSSGCALLMRRKKKSA